MGRTRYTRSVTLPLDTLVYQSDRRVAQVLTKYRIGSLNSTVDTGWNRYDAIIYGGHQPARCTIEAQEMSVKSQVRCNCTCKYFTMNLETVLAIYGVARPAQAHGMIPKQRNPTMKPGLCPHLYLLALHLGKQWTSKDEKVTTDVKDEVTERDIT